MQARIFQFAALGLLLVAGIAEPSTRNMELEFPWVPVDNLQGPALPANLPEGSAGCLVIGHHILVDGTTAKPRVMQGAYTGGVGEQAQADFAAAALATSARWRFRYAGTEPEPIPRFNLVVVGFVPAAGGAPARVVVGIEGQDKRIRKNCRLDSLADWGNRNAIPVDQARARKDDRMLMLHPGESAQYWVLDSEMRPPSYPRDAAMAGIEACVVVGYRIGVDGVPGNFRIMSSMLYDRAVQGHNQPFEAASINAVSKWRYAPGPDNLPRFPEFRQAPMDFRMGGGYGGPRCKPVNLGKAAGGDKP